MTSPLWLAFFSALCIAIIRVVVRNVMREKEDPLTVCMCYNIGAGLLLVSVFGLPSFTAVSNQVLWLLIASGVVWAIGGYCDTRSYVDLDASTNALFSALRYVLLIGATIIFHSEPLTAHAALGVLLIFLSIALNSNFSNLNFRRGVYFRLVSLIFINAGILVNKELTSITSLSLIIVSSYLMPGVLLALIAPKKFTAIPSMIRRVGVPIIIIIPLQAVIYGGYVYAFASGSLIEASTALHSSVILTFLIETAMEKKHENLMKRAIGALGCTLGVLLVTAW